MIIKWITDITATAKVRQSYFLQVALFGIDMSASIYIYISIYLSIYIKQIYIYIIYIWKEYRNKFIIVILGLRTLLML